MQDANSHESRQAKSIDPIWRILRVTRILCGIWLIAILILLFFAVKDQWIDAFICIIVPFALIYGIFPVFLQLMQERRWNSIAQRRAQALYHPASLLTSVLSRPASSESELNLPLHIQLRQSSKMSWLFVIFLIIMVIAGITLGVLASGNTELLHLEPLLIMLGFIIAMLLAVSIPFSFIQARYFTQTFDITAEGITTRYLNQQRSIRWDEVRVFARYTSQGSTSSASANTYELANEQTVVRWAQRLAIGIVVQSNQPEYDDVNWLIGQVNILVMARSGQPLLNLDEKRSSKQHLISRLAIQAETAMPQDESHLGQDDPIISKIRLGNSKKSTLISSTFGIGIIILSVLFQYPFHNESPFPSTLLYRYGIFFLLLALLNVMIIPRTQRYWLTIQHRRQIVVQHPEQYLATPQPVPTREQLQPAKLYISTSLHGQRQTVRAFTFLFLTIFVLAELFVFSLNPFYQLAILIGSLLLASVALLFGVFMRNKSTMQRIDVSTNGIASHYASNDAQINWQDARLFATYKNFKLLNTGASPDQIYELVGEQAVVRWSKRRMPTKAITTEPAMSTEEYERWLEHLHSYITEHTQLPLLDLDEREIS